MDIILSLERCRDLYRSKDEKLIKQFINELRVDVIVQLALDKVDRIDPLNKKYVLSLINDIQKEIRWLNYKIDYNRNTNILLCYGFSDQKNRIARLVNSLQFVLNQSID